MKNLFTAFTLLMLSPLSAQFKINIDAPESFTAKEALVYTLNGSKDVLYNAEVRKGSGWQINFTKPYNGMMKLYFPDGNSSLNFIAENKDVHLKLLTDKNKVSDVQYLDDSNIIMNNLQELQQKKEYILPALYQIKEYYKGESGFGGALTGEITRLTNANSDAGNHPFIQFYRTNYARFIQKDATKKAVTHDDIISFLKTAPSMLESSSLMRPVLVAYMNIGDRTNVATDIDRLLKEVDTKTSRGQTVLAELIDIFDMYDMQQLKEKYLVDALAIKSPNDRLAAAITSNKNTQVGSIFPNYQFRRASGTTAKSIHDVKANQKVIIFWASTCSHCEAELPKIVQQYNAFKGKGVEVIALSLDNEKEAYEKKIKELPWINDTELRGWNSSSAELYNVHATPTYFILDSANKIIAKPEHAADVITYFKLK